MHRIEVIFEKRIKRWSNYTKALTDVLIKVNGIAISQKTYDREDIGGHNHEICFAQTLARALGQAPNSIIMKST